jgi:hypothetical protein
MVSCLLSSWTVGKRTGVQGGKSECFAALPWQACHQCSCDRIHANIRMFAHAVDGVYVDFMDSAIVGTECVAQSGL